MIHSYVVYLANNLLPKILLIIYVHTTSDNALTYV